MSQIFEDFVLGVVLR